MSPVASVAESSRTEVSSAESTPPQRLVSVDALRGFDMFWIIGASSLVLALQHMTSTPLTGFLADQFEHADWEGLHFYDLIFPLFIFIIGVSLVFSLSKTLEREGRAVALKRIFWRSLLLYLCGMFYHGGLSHPWPDVRFSAGYSAILLGVFYQIIDIWGAQKWCQPFIWLGMNPTTIYLVAEIIGGFDKLALRFAGGDIQQFFNTHVTQGFGELVVCIVGLGLAFWFVHFLYRRKIFIRL